LIGRTPEDVKSIDGISLINDKDSWRQQIVSGNADCFVPKRENSVYWKQAQKIVMQVGDNIQDIQDIQDIQGIKQETVDTDKLRDLMGNTIVLIPNPMYGS
jgi:predicted secreted acid phosphatase